jgi:hypothetical protein
MHRNAENKLFLKCKTNNFFKKILFLLFSNFTRFYAVNEENFHSDLRATYTKHALQKLMQKTSFQATDATTQSSNQEENERIFFFISLQNTQQGKMMTRSKPRELKKKKTLA